jgi:hypothetical protein
MDQPRGLERAEVSSGGPHLLDLEEAEQLGVGDLEGPIAWPVGAGSIVGMLRHESQRLGSPAVPIALAEAVVEVGPNPGEFDDGLAVRGDRWTIGVGRLAYRERENFLHRGLPSRGKDDGPGAGLIHPAGAVIDTHGAGKGPAA